MDGGADPRALGQTPRTTATAPRSLDVLPVRLGPYLVERRLGAGGMGVVFEALEVDRDRRVALKLLPAHEPDSLARFKAEFRIVADVAHPNLVTLYELQAVDGYWFIAMERLDGSVHRRNMIETCLLP
jgi:serine/threonine protein kinase